jgi:Flp pilus assembly protein CpaB
MRSRGLVVAIAVVLAVLAAAGFIVYTNNLEKNVLTEKTTLVVVSKQDIPANTPLAPLYDAGAFIQINVPNDAVVAGAVTDPAELRAETSAAPIFANEQIPASRLASGGGINVVGISPGHIGLGLTLDGPAAVNGLISQGDNVVVFAHFKKGTPVTKETLDRLLTASQIQKFFDTFSGSSGALASQPVYFMPADFTVTLVASVKVLAIQNPPLDQTTGRRTEGGTSLALDLLPVDASSLVFATQAGTLYLGLLSPDDEKGFNQGATIGVPLVRVSGVGGS